MTIGLVLFYEHQLEKAQEERMEMQEKAWYDGKHIGQEERDLQWKKIILPLKLDSARQQGIAFQDSVWQGRLPKIIAVADSIGYIRGQADADEDFQQALSDTLHVLRNQIKDCEQGCQQCKGQQRLKHSFVAALWRHFFPPWLHILWKDPNARPAWGLLVFGLTLLFMRSLANRRDRKAIRYWRRRRGGLLW